MSSIEVEAKTKEEAINKACEQLNSTQDQLEIEVISDDPGKMFGILASKKVRIKATLKETGIDDDAQRAKEVLENILERFGAEVLVESSEDEEGVVLTIKGDGSGILIGRKGQTLDAFQYLVNKIVHRTPNDKKRIVVDTEGYRQRRREGLIELAKNLGEKAKSKDTSVSTGPLNPFERRIIHLALQNDASLTTKSNGEGAYRRVVISPNKQATSS